MVFKRGGPSGSPGTVGRAKIANRATQSKILGIYYNKHTQDYGV